MALPSDQIPPDAAALMRRLDEMERRLSEGSAARAAESTTIGQGGLVVKSGGEFSVMHETTNAWVMHTGKGASDKYFVTLRRDDGSVVLEVSTTPSGDQFCTLRDRANRILYADDANSGVGMARPWLPVVMYCKVGMAAGVFNYVNFTASGTEQQIWEGRVPLVSHPWIAVDGIWGQASGTNTTTYRLKVVGGATLGSWSVGGGLANDVRGPYNIQPYIEQNWLPIQLTAQSTGTGLVACQINGCTLRQS